MEMGVLSSVMVLFVLSTLVIVFPSETVSPLEFTASIICPTARLRTVSTV